MHNYKINISACGILLLFIPYNENICYIYKTNVCVLCVYNITFSVYCNYNS